MKTSSSWDMEMAEDSVHCQPNLNPMLMSHIVKQMLSYCPFKDLKNARLVSKLWKDASSEYFKSRRTIRFKNFSHIDTFMLTPESEDLDLCRNVCLYGTDFQQWVIMLKPFFSRFGSHIKSLNISHGIGDVTEDFMLQIAQHVESLEELSISGTTVVYSDRFMDTIAGIGFQFLPILPSVRKVNLKLPVTCFKRWSDVRTFFIDFFSLFPNLEEIKFVGCQFPELFRYLPQEIRFPKLHCVHLQLVNSNGLSDLISRNFILSRITLDVEPLLGLDNLHAFLEAFKDHLKYLDMRFHFKGPYNYSHNATEFPSAGALKQLISFRLYGFWGNLYFLKEFPKLKKAVVEKMKWNVAFPNGTEKILCCREILKFFDENGVHHEL